MRHLNNLPICVLLVTLVGCSDSDASDEPAADMALDSAADDGQPDQGDVVIGEAIDPSHFLSSGLLAGSTITTEPCTLSGGTATTCYKIQTHGVPTDHALGPFCPRSITDGPEAGGIWPEGGVAHDVSGDFIKNLSTFYNDPRWKLYDEQTGEINVTDTQESCQGAARPDVDAQYQNHCVECSMDYIAGGKISLTFLLPVKPVPLASPGRLGRGGAVGVSLGGTIFDGPAPTAAILGAYTIAAFDDCGGHINLNAGYHYHGAAGCGTKIAQADKHAPLIGYAMDGYGMYAMLDERGVEPDDLDGCRGHEDATRGYHYHVAGAGENMFIGCFKGEQGSKR